MWRCISSWKDSVLYDTWCAVYTIQPFRCISGLFSVQICQCWKHSEVPTQLRCYSNADATSSWADLGTLGWLRVRPCFLVVMTSFIKPYYRYSQPCWKFPAPIRGSDDHLRWAGKSKRWIICFTTCRCPPGRRDRSNACWPFSFWDPVSRVIFWGRELYMHRQHISDYKRPRAFYSKYPVYKESQDVELPRRS